MPFISRRYRLKSTIQALMDNNYLSENKLLITFLRSRFIFPLKSTAFTLYFFTIIVIVGLVASLFGAFETVDTAKSIDFRSISISLTGYSLVLLCSSAIEFIFVNFKGDEEEFTSLKEPLTMIGVTAIILGLFTSALVYWIKYDWLQFIISLVMTILTWFFWWISNSRTLSVINNYPPRVTDTTGGDNPIQGNINSEYTF